MDYFEAFEADFATPFLEIGAGVIERFAEFDQHVEGHEEPEDVFPAGIVDQRFHCDERAAFRQCIVNGAGRSCALIPMQDHRKLAGQGLSLASAKFVVRVMLQRWTWADGYGKNTNSERSDWYKRQRRGREEFEGGNWLFAAA